MLRHQKNVSNNWFVVIKFVPSVPGVVVNVISKLRSFNYILNPPNKADMMTSSKIEMSQWSPELDKVLVI